MYTVSMASQGNAHESVDRIRVLIVDEHTAVRRAIAAFLHAFDDLKLAGEASKGEEALRLCARLQPDVVLMGMSMPDMNSRTATRMIYERWPFIRVLALVSFQEGGLVQEVLEAGAVGHVLKNVSADELAEAIRAAYAGRSPGASEDSPGTTVTPGPSGGANTLRWSGERPVV